VRTYGTTMRTARRRHLVDGARRYQGVLTEPASADVPKGRHWGPALGPVRSEVSAQAGDDPVLVPLAQVMVERKDERTFGEPFGDGQRRGRLSQVRRLAVCSHNPAPGRDAVAVKQRQQLVAPDRSVGSKLHPVGLEVRRAVRRVRCHHDSQVAQELGIARGQTAAASHKLLEPPELDEAHGRLDVGHAEVVTRL
jgi:hypothetical protein